LREEQRRLAAILAADVAGYSRLMAADEVGTLARLKSLRAEVFEPKTAQFHGRIVGSAGDSLLIEFASAVNAVECAVELQEELGSRNASLPEDRRMAFRMGVNLGDVIAEGDTIHGDGVNIAARLEKLAEPGGVCIGRAIHDQVKGKLACAYDDLGEQRVHNIPEPVRVYRVKPAKGSPGSSPGSPSKDALDRPSIAVLPFTNMSGDPEQEYFSDGITEDVITDLSQVSALFVVARNMTFMFKGRPVEIVEAARKLNVSHILEGSVRKAGSRVRISVQLIDGTTGGHIWAERYDRELVDVFAVQDEIAKNVVAALKVKLLPKELESIADRTTSNPDAYEFYLQGRAKFLESGWGSKPSMKAARKLFSKAVEIDPNYAKAYAGIAGCDAFLWVAGDPDTSYEAMQANSDKALQLAPQLAEAHAARGMAFLTAGRSEESAAAFARAIELDPLVYGVHYFYGLVCREVGDLNKAAALFHRAAELRPGDFGALSLLADVYQAQGRHEESRAAARRGLIRVESILSQRPDTADVLAMGAANAVYVDEYDHAREWAGRAIELEPENYLARYNAACAYAVMGNVDAAMKHLQHIYTNIPRARQWLLRLLAVDPQLVSLHGRPEFQELLRRLEADAP
jgi:adenylate cyclase